MIKKIIKKLLPKRPVIIIPGKDDKVVDGIFKDTKK